MSADLTDTTDPFGAFDAAIAADEPDTTPDDATDEPDEAAEGAATEDTDTPDAADTDTRDDAETPESGTEPAEPDYAPVLDAVRRAVPGIALPEGTPDAIAEAFRAQYDTAQQYAGGLAVLADAVEKVAGTDVFVREVGKTGDPIAAFLAAYPDLQDAVDPEEGSAQWNTVQQAKREAAIRAEYETKDAKRVADTTARWEADAARAFDTFATEAEASGVDVDRFAEFYASLFVPTPEGRFRGDHFQQVLKAFTADDDQKRARAEGESAGYARAVAEIEAKNKPARDKDGHFARKSDGVPGTRGGGGSTGAAPSGFGSVRTRDTLDDIYGPAVPA